MAAGVGLYALAGLGTVLVLIVLALLDRLEAFARRRLEIGPEGFDVSDKLNRSRGSEGHTEDLE